MISVFLSVLYKRQKVFEIQNKFPEDEGNLVSQKFTFVPEQFLCVTTRDGGLQTKSYRRHHGFLTE